MAKKCDYCGGYTEGDFMDEVKVRPPGRADYDTRASLALRIPGLLGNRQACLRCLVKLLQEALEKDPCPSSPK